MPAPMATQEIGGRSEGGWHWWREFVFAFLAFGLRKILESRFVYRIGSGSSPGLVKSSLGCRDPSWLTETSRYMHKQYRGPL